MDPKFYVSFFCHITRWNKYPVVKIDEAYGDMVDHRSYAHNLSSCKIKAWKKIRPERDLNPWPLRYRYISCVRNCDYQSDLHIIPRSSNIWAFIYSLVINDAVRKKFERPQLHRQCMCFVTNNIDSQSIEWGWGRLVDVGDKVTWYGSRSFSVASSKLWNALPLDIRSSDNLMQSKRNIKTHLFRKAFY